jgi:hypothetical protein
MRVKQHKYTGETIGARTVPITVSATSINTYQTCRKRYEYEKIKHIKCTEPTDALDFGVAIHKALEVIFKSLMEPDANMSITLDNALDALRYECAARGISQSDEIKARALIRAYVALHFEEDQQLFDVVAVENPFTFQIPGMSQKVTGFIDAIVKPKGADDTYYVVEHKTAGIVSDGYLKRVKIDWQTAIYTEAVKNMFGHDKTVHVIYDIIRKPKHEQSLGETDEEFEARKAASKCPSRIKRKVAETNGEFFERVFENAHEYLQRELVLYNDGVAKSFKSELRAAVKEMARPRQVYYKCTCNCLKYGECPYMDLCCANGNLNDTPEDKYTTEAQYVQ